MYHKEPVLNVEIHKSLFNSTHEVRFQKYFQRYLVSPEKSNTYVCQFSLEDYYIFLITHEYRHYSKSGTGLRSLMDTYVYTKNVPLDFAYITEEMEKLGLSEFEKSNRQLSTKLFSGKNLTEEEQKQLDYILSSGTYGTIYHRVDNELNKKNWTKMDYAVHRFFTPISKKNKDYAAYAKAYPLFYRHKILLPFLPFYRIIRSIKSGHFSSEADALKKARRKEL
ncbi:MAG: nucleotidyltransferase family protein [Firmicutes bacterium]|nr:nucleotidyltransferase family protein [Bacillota bacterium]